MRYETSLWSHETSRDFLCASDNLSFAQRASVCIYIFGRPKRLQFQLYTHYLDLRRLLHLQLPFFDFWLPHSILHEDNGASRRVKKPAALLGNNIPF
jgi:hypothetical protein